MNRNFVSAELVTLDATVAHPGFSPFAKQKARREAAAQLADLELTDDEQRFRFAFLNHCTPREGLRVRVAIRTLLRVARDGE